jgi:hypothetical protein
VEATDAEIMVAAKLFSCDIVIHSNIGDSMKWVTYPASFDPDSTTDHAIFLINKHYHFDVVISVEM